MADLNAAIVPKQSNTASAAPIASQLLVGEIAINTADGKLFTKHTDGTIKEISGSGGGGGGGAVDSVNGQTGTVSLGIQDMNDFQLKTSDSAYSFTYNVSDSNAIGVVSAGQQTVGEAVNVFWDFHPEDANGDLRDADWQAIILAFNEGSTVLVSYEQAGGNYVVYPATSFTAGANNSYYRIFSDDPAAIAAPPTDDRGTNVVVTVVGDAIPLADGDVLVWNASKQVFEPGSGGSGGGSSENGLPGDVNWGVPVDGDIARYYESASDSATLYLSFSDDNNVEGMTGNPITYLGDGYTSTGLYGEAFATPNAATSSSVATCAVIPWHPSYEIGGAEKFTIEGWVRKDIFSSADGTLAPILQHRNDSGDWRDSNGGHAFSFYPFTHGSNEGKVRFIFGSNTDGQEFDSVSSGPFLVGVWSHVCVQRDGSTLYFYRDGVMFDSVNVAGRACFDGSTYDLIVGSLGKQSVGARTPVSYDEIRLAVGYNLYPTSGFTPKDTEINVQSDISEWRLGSAPEEAPYNGQAYVRQSRAWQVADFQVLEDTSIDNTTSSATVSVTLGSEEYFSDPSNVTSSQRLVWNLGSAPYQYAGVSYYKSGAVSLVGGVDANSRAAVNVTNSKISLGTNPHSTAGGAEWTVVVNTGDTAADRSMVYQDAPVLGTDETDLVIPAMGQVRSEITAAIDTTATVLDDLDDVNYGLNGLGALVLQGQYSDEMIVITDNGNDFPKAVGEWGFYQGDSASWPDTGFVMVATEDAGNTNHGTAFDDVVANPSAYAVSLLLDGQVVGPLPVLEAVLQESGDRYRFDYSITATGIDPVDYNTGGYSADNPDPGSPRTVARPMGFILSSVSEVRDDGEYLKWDAPNNRWTNARLTPETTWMLSAQDTTAYLFSGPGFPAVTSNPELTLSKGNIYRFQNNTGMHPFEIQLPDGTPYNTGVTNNGQIGVVTFDVPMDAPEELQYVCTSHSGMTGTIKVGGSSSGGGGGAVDSVNGKTGVVSLGIQDMDDYALAVQAGVDSGFTTLVAATTDVTAADEFIYANNSSTPGNNFFAWLTGSHSSTLQTLEVGDEVTFSSTGLTDFTSTVSQGVTTSGSEPVTYVRMTDNWPQEWIDAPVGPMSVAVASTRFVGEQVIPLAEGDVLQWDATDEKFKPAQLPSGGAGGYDRVVGGSFGSGV